MGMGRRIKLGLIFMVILGLVGYGIGFAVGLFATGSEASEAATGVYAIVCTIVGALTGLGMGLFSRRKISSASNVGTTAEGDETEVNFDSKFITPEEMKRDKELIYSTWNNLPSLQKTGFAFRMK